MNMKRSLLSAALSGLLLMPPLSHADDIDLYTGGSSGGDANVLIVLDNESNWDATMDSDPPADLSQPLPANEKSVHFGKGQTETSVTLPPGKHTLQLVLGDSLHIPHDPAVMSKKITITVEK